jgi:hypothetical protein
MYRPVTACDSSPTCDVPCGRDPGLQGTSTDDTLSGVHPSLAGLARGSGAAHGPGGGGGGNMERVYSLGSSAAGGVDDGGRAAQVRCWPWFSLHVGSFAE